MAIDELQSARRESQYAITRLRSARVRVIEPRKLGIRATIAEFWRFRRFALYFGRQFLTRRYSRTWLGLSWIPLRSILNVGAKLLVFGGLVGITAGNTPYPVFFLLASAAWLLFSETVLWSTRSLDFNRGLLRDFHIPRLVVICSAIVPGAIDFAVTVGIAVAALIYYLIRANTFYLELTLWSPLCIIVALWLLAMLAVGVGLITASVGARARDIRFGLTYAIGFLYFLTPVIYPFEAIPDSFKPVAELNPVTGALEIFKLGLFPHEEVSPKAIAVTVVAVLALWLPGLWLFQRQEARHL